MAPFFYYLGTFAAGWWAGGLVQRGAKKLLAYELSFFPPAEREKVIATWRKQNPHWDLSERDYAAIMAAPVPEWAQHMHARGHVTVVVVDPDEVGST